MAHSGRTDEERQRRVERFRHRQEGERQLLLGLILGGGALLFLVVVILVVSSGSSSTPQRPSVVIQPHPPAGEPEESLTPESVHKTDARHPAPSEHPDTGKPKRSPLRERIDKAFEAAKRRAENYAKEGRWGDALAAMEAVQGDFDDMELRLRCQPIVDELNDKARGAYRAKRAEAEQLAQAGRYDDACKALTEITDKLKLDQYKDEVKKRVEELMQKKAVEAEANYVRQMTPVEADIAGWGFQAALEKASKLRFNEPMYQEQLKTRIERIRELIALRQKMIDRVNGAMPRLTRRALRVPGGLDGELVEADHNRIVAEGNRGREVIPWPKFGAEATTRLALLAGKETDPKCRLEVARLLMEVGYFPRAKEQMELAGKLGGDPAADLAELEKRVAAAGKAKAEPKEAPKAPEPKEKAEGG